MADRVGAQPALLQTLTRQGCREKGVSLQISELLDMCLQLCSGMCFLASKVLTRMSHCGVPSLALCTSLSVSGCHVCLCVDFCPPCLSPCPRTKTLCQLMSKLRSDLSTWIWQRATVFLELTTLQRSAILAWCELDTLVCVCCRGYEAILPICCIHSAPLWCTRAENYIAA